MKLLLLSLFTCGLYAQTMHTVNAGSMYFDPQNIVIDQGDSIEFINDGGFHDVVVTSGPEMLYLPSCSGPCTIGVLVFNSPGSYEYECSVGSHASQGMVGTITVNALNGTADVQIVHNSPSPIVDIYVNNELALEDIPFRASTGLIGLPLDVEVGIAPANGNIIASFPFELIEDNKYLVVASGIVGDADGPFDLLATTLEEEAESDETFALKVLHGVTDAPAVDIYANGVLLVENLAYGEFQGYLQVPVGDYTLDITENGSTVSLASFSAPLSSFGGFSGLVYASGFLAPENDEPGFGLVLTTPSGYVVELPPEESGLASPLVQIIHNSPYPTVDIYVNEDLALEAVPYRASTGLIELPLSTTVGVAPTGEEIIASFPFELTAMQKYAVVATGIVGDTNHPFDLIATSLQEEAADDDHFSLKVMHGVTDAPSVDIYANGGLLVENLSYGEFQGYVDVPADDYTLDITVHGETNSVASFSAPLSSFGGMSGVVYASGFLNPTETDSSFTLVLTTPSGYIVTLPASGSALSTEELTNSVPNDYVLLQNFPNPFNPSTSIAYRLQTLSPVAITIYDLMGNVVNNLYAGIEGPGYKSINWDATNNNGDLVSSGMYFYKLQVGESFEIKRMMYLK